MYSSIISGGILGVEGILIRVETDIHDGLPVFNMVGYLSSCVREAGERVRTALKNSMYYLPPKRITINLSPADVRKEGTAFDLPIAIGILVSMGMIPEKNAKGILLIGELSLDGHVNAVRGVLSVVHHAFKQGIRRCIVPKGNGKEAALIAGMEVFAVTTLSETASFLNGDLDLIPEQVDIKQIFLRQESEPYEDFADIKGQAVLKRGMEIAAAGMHNILMTGAAGSGKSMIAKRLPGILPRLTFEESIEITKIYSIAGLLPENEALITKRPFRAPHHTITPTALAGGGVIPRPGEISLSHNAVLFLDELPEFNRNTLEVMRQPMEDGAVTISRLNATYRFPANFMLVAARNSCPCGHYPDMNKCTCTLREIRRYQAKISKPLLDRIDINVEVTPVEAEKLFEKGYEESSERIRERVYHAQSRQQLRYQNEQIRFNSQLDTSLCDKYIVLGSSEKDFLVHMYQALSLSARGGYRILKLARTIADLEDCDKVSISHLKEAVFYRNIDKAGGI